MFRYVVLFVTESVSRILGVLFVFCFVRFWWVFAFINRSALLKMAERERFELSRGFLPCTLSKGVPSATRPPFLTNSETLSKVRRRRKDILVINFDALCIKFAIVIGFP